MLQKVRLMVPHGGLKEFHPIMRILANLVRLLGVFKNVIE